MSPEGAGSDCHYCPAHTLLLHLIGEMHGLGNTVMFYGDGIIDLATLQAADVGFAVGATAASVAPTANFCSRCACCNEHVNQFINLSAAGGDVRHCFFVSRTVLGFQNLSQNPYPQAVCLGHHRYKNVCGLRSWHLCAWGNVAVHEVKPRRDYCWLKTISNPPHPLASARLANF